MFNCENLHVGKSKNGYGIFAKKKFSKGEDVFEIKGKFLELNEEDAVDDKIRDNAFRFSKDVYISPQGEIGDFLNHSCNPNAGVIKRNNALIIVAIEDIKKGKEITIDYSTITAADDIWEMNCNCREKNCRSTIRNFGTLDQKTKDEYLGLSIVPDYVVSLPKNKEG